MYYANILDVSHCCGRDCSAFILYSRGSRGTCGCIFDISVRIECIDIYRCRDVYVCVRENMCESEYVYDRVCVCACPQRTGMSFS